ncbi:hypothetical protein NVP1077O_60 [Vibrio phage 1.077.O._10N.261.45.A10]|nr:hypothetical protein NVP1077O_60 [Vibrio phage 1.077.O._10N.261.45.A10]
MHPVFIQSPVTPGNPTQQGIENAIIHVCINVLSINMNGVRSTDDMKADSLFLSSFCREVGETLAATPNGNFECDAVRQGMSTRGILAEFYNILDIQLQSIGNLRGVTYEVFATALWDSYIDNWHQSPKTYITNAVQALSLHVPQGNVATTAVPVFGAQYGAQPAPSTNHKSTPAGSGRDINAEVLALAIEGVNKTACEFSQTPAVKNLNKIIALLEGEQS